MIGLKYVIWDVIKLDVNKIKMLAIFITSLLTTP
mgnify:CR=1 FL=1